MGWVADPTLFDPPGLYQVSQTSGLQLAYSALKYILQVNKGAISAQKRSGDYSFCLDLLLMFFTYISIGMLAVIHCGSIFLFGLSECTKFTFFTAKMWKNFREGGSNGIIRPHRMHTIHVDAAYCCMWRGLCVCVHNNQVSCKNVRYPA